MSADHDGALVQPGKGGTHGFFPGMPRCQTGFVGYDPGFAAGKVILQMALQDIAPITAQLLGFSFNPSKSVLPAQVILQ